MMKSHYFKLADIIMQRTQFSNCRGTSLLHNYIKWQKVCLYRKPLRGPDHKSTKMRLEDS